MSRREGRLVGRGEKAVPGEDLYPLNWGWSSPAEQLPEPPECTCPPYPPSSRHGLRSGGPGGGT